MSGGSLDYSYSKINEVIEKLQERLDGDISSKQMEMDWK